VLGVSLGTFGCLELVEEVRVDRETIRARPLPLVAGDEAVTTSAWRAVELTSSSAALVMSVGPVWPMSSAWRAYPLGTVARINVARPDAGPVAWVDVPEAVVPVDVDVWDVVGALDDVAATVVAVGCGGSAFGELVQADASASSAQAAPTARRVRTQREASAALRRSRVECSLNGVGGLGPRGGTR